MNKIHLFLRFINYKTLPHNIKIRVELFQHGYKTTLVIYADFVSKDGSHTVKTKKKHLFAISIKETDPAYICNWIENTAYQEMVNHFVFNTPKILKKIK